jgi:hypothetical protein
MARLLRAVPRSSLAILGLIAVAACDRSTRPIEGDFGGIHYWGWESSGFRGCLASETWWMTGELRPIFDALFPDAPRPVEGAAYIRVRGTRSTRGRYGHLGAYPYELVVHEVLDVSADTVGKCR